LMSLLAEHPEVDIEPSWSIQKGSDRVSLDDLGHIKALQPGDVTLQGSIPGIAAENGFLFIQALGQVGAIDGQLLTQTDSGPKINFEAIHWDIFLMVIGFGVSLYINQLLTGQQQGGNAQQQAINQYIPIIFSGMFLFFPLPSGVLLYMLLGNIFQTIQSAILSREPLPENLQKIIDEEERRAKNKGISKENEIFALETGSASAKSKSSPAVEPKPFGFNAGNSGADESPGRSGGILGEMKSRLQEAFTEAQEAERAKLEQRTRSDASKQTIDVKAQDVSVNKKAQSNSPKPSNKNSAKKKRKNRPK
jgi:hypothetical protein